MVKTEAKLRRALMKSREQTVTDYVCVAGFIWWIVLVVVTIVTM
jgi:hypothetical protein